MRKRKLMAASAGAAKSAAVAVVSDNGNFPTEKEIAALAYSFWEARGPADGSPAGDWLRAENELRTQPR